VGVNIRDRHVMFAFAGCAALATLWHRIVLDGVASGQVLNAPFSAAEALALFALFVVITRMKNDALFTRFDLLTIAALSVAFVLPSMKVAYAAMTATALMFVTRRDARLTSIGQLLLALVSFQYFARLIFDLIAHALAGDHRRHDTPVAAWRLQQRRLRYSWTKWICNLYRTAVLRHSQHQRCGHYLVGVDQD
jgi:hypothetical protein